MQAETRSGENAHTPALPVHTSTPETRIKLTGKILTFETRFRRRRIQIPHNRQRPIIPIPERAERTERLLGAAQPPLLLRQQVAYTLSSAFATYNPHEREEGDTD